MKCSHRRSDVNTEPQLFASIFDATQAAVVEVIEAKICVLFMPYISHRSTNRFDFLFDYTLSNCNGTPMQIKTTELIDGSPRCRMALLLQSPCEKKKVYSTEMKTETNTIDKSLMFDEHCAINLSP